MMERTQLLTLAVIAIAGCGTTDPSPVILYPVQVPHEHVVELRPAEKIVVAAPSMPAEAPAPVRPVRADIIVTTARKLDRATELVGVIDAHQPSGGQDAAFAMLRQRAAAMGADAVVGVEFHHGEDKEEAAHLSGIAVRYVGGLR